MMVKDPNPTMSKSKFASPYSIALPRGSATTIATMRRRKTTSGATSSMVAKTMLKFYADDGPRLEISANAVLVMSISFIAFVGILFITGKLYFIRKEA
ncbi:Uncharacterized protein TCM_045472 [Theobroma cacao]|uniref:Protein transport protein Sec61 subunit beta n=1 Tax=Theobroma cacao TaxID=3641 RepID=A0A061FTG8_THECC|nr:Uncharacterized protein TCM_045472 [Theobroma cacao]